MVSFSVQNDVNFVFRIYNVRETKNYFIFCAFDSNKKQKTVSSWSLALLNHGKIIWKKGPSLVNKIIFNFFNNHVAHLPLFLSWNFIPCAIRWKNVIKMTRSFEKATLNLKSDLRKKRIKVTVLCYVPCCST